MRCLPPARARLWFWSMGIWRRVCAVNPGPVLVDSVVTVREEGWIVTVDQRVLLLREVDPQVAIGHLERDVGDERVGADLGVVAVPHGHIGGLACPGREFVDLGSMVREGF